MRRIIALLMLTAAASAQDRPIITSDLSDGISDRGDYAEYTISASGQPTGYGAVGLPPGMNCAAATGLISGRPSSEGVYTISLWASNAAGQSAIAKKRWLVYLPPPVIQNTTLSTGVVGRDYSADLVATNSPQYYKLLAGSLPPGVLLDVFTGRFSGRPTQAGDFPLTISAVNQRAESQGKALAIHIDTPPSRIPVIQTTSIPDIMANVGCNIQLEASFQPTVWTITGGSLPLGLSLANSGVISGLATPGSYSFSVTAGNSLGTSLPRTFTLKVKQDELDWKVHTIAGIPQGMTGSTAQQPDNNCVAASFATVLGWSGSRELNDCHRVAASLGWGPGDGSYLSWVSSVDHFLVLLRSGCPDKDVEVKTQLQIYPLELSGVIERIIDSSPVVILAKEHAIVLVGRATNSSGRVVSYSFWDPSGYATEILGFSPPGGAGFYTMSASQLNELGGVDARLFYFGSKPATALGSQVAVSLRHDLVLPPLDISDGQSKYWWVQADGEPFMGWQKEGLDAVSTKVSVANKSITISARPSIIGGPRGSGLTSVRLSVLDRSGQVLHSTPDLILDVAGFSYSPSVVLPRLTGVILPPGRYQVKISVSAGQYSTATSTEVDIVDVQASPNAKQNSPPAVPGISFPVDQAGGNGACGLGGLGALLICAAVALGLSISMRRSGT